MDASHAFGFDLDLSASGDLLIVDNVTESNQHVVKRLLTNPGDYIWHLAYGAGLGQFVGQPMNQSHIENAVNSQIFMEADVAQFPLPIVTTTANVDGTNTVNIVYTSASTGQTQTLSFPLGN